MLTRRRGLALTLAAGALLSLSACAKADNDRPGSAGGKDPDGLANATHVLVYRNADEVPNVAYFCAGPYGWAATLSGSDKGGNKASTIVRMQEYDGQCKGEEIPATK